MSVRRALNHVGRSSRQVIAALLLAGVAPLFAQQSIDSDMPEGQAGQIDEATYLRLRSVHIARLRGVLAGKDPAARGRAIRAMAAQEERTCRRAKRGRLTRRHTYGSGQCTLPVCAGF